MKEPEAGCVDRFVRGRENWENARRCSVAMTSEELAKLLESLGCPVAKSVEMAAQLDKRAKQLANQKNRSYDEALLHLLELMRQGWAAKERNL